MRMFTAVELPPEVRERVAAAAGALVAGVRAVKPVAPENLHVTVRFLGDVADGAVAGVVEALRGAAASTGAGEASAAGLGAFPDARRPRVLWAGVDDPAGVLPRLEAAVSQALAGLGFPREERAFSAHVTVGRVRDGARDLGPLQARLAAAPPGEPAFGGFPVREITLFRSDLGPAGPRYTPLARLPLGVPG